MRRIRILAGSITTVLLTVCYYTTTLHTFSDLFPGQPG